MDKHTRDLFVTSLQYAGQSPPPTEERMKEIRAEFAEKMKPKKEACKPQGSTKSDPEPTPREIRESYLKNVRDGMYVPTIAAEMDILADNSETLEHKIEAFEMIQILFDECDKVGNMNKEEWWELFLSYLQSEHSQLRAWTAYCVRAAVSNHDANQKKLRGRNVIPALMRMALSDTDQMVRERAITALSALTRNYKEGLQETQHLLPDALKLDIAKRVVRADVISAVNVIQTVVTTQSAKLADLKQKITQAETEVKAIAEEKAATKAPKPTAETRSVDENADRANSKNTNNGKEVEEDANIQRIDEADWNANSTEEEHSNATKNGTASMGAVDKDVQETETTHAESLLADQELAKQIEDNLNVQKILLALLGYVLSYVLNAADMISIRRCQRDFDAVNKYLPKAFHLNIDGLLDYNSMAAIEFMENLLRVNAGLPKRVVFGDIDSKMDIEVGDSNNDFAKDAEFVANENTPEGEIANDSGNRAKTTANDWFKNEKNNTTASRVNNDESWDMADVSEPMDVDAEVTKKI